MTAVTLIGNLTADPELKFTPQGKAVASFTIAESSRVKVGGEWKDGPSTFWRCQLWGEAAENLAETLQRGNRVIAVGDVKQRSFETSSGEKRTVTEVTVSEIGPSLRWATAKLERLNRTGMAKPKPAADDPWSAIPPADEEPPF